MIAKKKVTTATSIIVISICFFLVLPYPFQVNRWSCPNNPCEFISDYQRHEKVQWAWMGGYRIAIDRFLPKSGGPEQEMFISKYYGVTYSGLIGFGIVSLLLGSGAYFGTRRLTEKGIEANSPPQTFRDG